MTQLLRRLPVVLVALAVVTSVSTASGTARPAWLALAGMTTALTLSAVGAHRHALLLVLTAGAIAAAQLTNLAEGGQVQRWLTLACLPAVVPLAGLSLIRPSRAAWLVMAGALVAGPGRTLFYDPFLDVDCSGCQPVPALLRDRSGTEWVLLAGGLLALLGLAMSLRRATQPLPLAVVVVAGSVAMTGWRTPQGALPEAVWVAGMAAVVGGMVALASALLTRHRLARLEKAFRSGRGPEQSLSETLRDPLLSLDFADDGSWVDTCGAVAPGPRAGQVSTPVVVGNTTIARIHHARDSGRTDLLASSLTPELRLGIEHARLTAGLQSQVRELQESRVRVVEAADSHRRQIERDLHDGAQQHLLALGFDLRRSLATTPHDPALQRCLAETTAALAELRTLASGVYPALLTSAGLGPAVEELGRRLLHPVTIRQLPECRLPAAIERTAYLLVAELAELAPVRLRAEVHDATLVLEITGATLPEAPLLRERVEALGGTLSSMTDLTELRLPCG